MVLVFKKNMLKNLLVFESIIKNSPSYGGSIFRPPLAMGSASVPDLRDLTHSRHSCCTATKRFSRPLKSLFFSIFILLSRESDGGAIFWKNSY